MTENLDQGPNPTENGRERRPKCRGQGRTRPIGMPASCFFPACYSHSRRQGVPDRGLVCLWEMVHPAERRLTLLLWLDRTSGLDRVHQGDRSEG